MKATLNLNNPLWQTAERRAILDKVVQESAAELEAKIKLKIQNSSPSGRTYRRAAIFKGGKTAAFNFHRASRRGQPFANDTGGTLNATRAKKLGPMRATVFNSKKHADILDRKDKLDRPFFRSTAEEFKVTFKENLATAIREVKTT